jgi:hypothetical protein
MAQVTIKLTKSHSVGESNFWEAKCCSSGQATPRILWNSKIYYRVHNSPPLVLVLRQMNPAHVLLYYFFKINFNIILQYTPTSSKYLHAFRFSNQNTEGIRFALAHATWLSHPPRFHHPTNIWKKLQIMKLLITLFAASCYFSGWLFYCALNM